MYWANRLTLGPQFSHLEKGTEGLRDLAEPTQLLSDLSHLFTPRRIILYLQTEGESHSSMIEK